MRSRKTQPELPIRHRFIRRDASKSRPARHELRSRDVFLDSPSRAFAARWLFDNFEVATGIGIPRATAGAISQITWERLGAG